MRTPDTIGPVERALWLRSVPPFTGLRARPLAALARLTREEIVRAGRPVQPPGRVSRTLRVLLEGRLRLSGDRGADVVLEAPRAVGLVELLAGRALRSGLVAERDAIILAVDGPALLDLLEEEPLLVPPLRQALGRALAAAQAERGDWAPEPAREPPPAPPRDLTRFVERMLALHAVPMLRAFGVAVLATLLRDEPARRIAAGETIAAAGDVADRLIVIADGAAIGTAPDGTTFRVGAGSMLGDNEALSGLPLACTVRAETPATVIALAARQIWDAAEDHAHVARALLGAAARHLLRLDGGMVARFAPPEPSPIEGEASWYGAPW